MSERLAACIYCGEVTPARVVCQECRILSTPFTEEWAAAHPGGYLLPNDVNGRALARGTLMGLIMGVHHAGGLTGEAARKLAVSLMDIQGAEAIRVWVPRVREEGIPPYNRALYEALERTA